MSYLSLLAEIMSSNSFIKIVVAIVNIIVHFTLHRAILSATCNNFFMIGMILDLSIASYIGYSLEL